MGKALNIKDPKTYEMAAKLASLTGVSMTQAVKQAVIMELEALKKRQRAAVETPIEERPTLEVAPRAREDN